MLMKGSNVIATETSVFFTFSENKNDPFFERAFIQISSAKCHKKNNQNLFSAFSKGDHYVMPFLGKCFLFQLKVIRSINKVLLTLYRAELRIT